MAPRNPPWLCSAQQAASSCPAREAHVTLGGRMWLPWPAGAAGTALHAGLLHPGTAAGVVSPPCRPEGQRHHGAVMWGRGAPRSWSQCPFKAPRGGVRVTAIRDGGGCRHRGAECSWGVGSGPSPERDGGSPLRPVRGSGPRFLPDSPTRALLAQPGGRSRSGGSPGGSGPARQAEAALGELGSKGSFGQDTDCPGRGARSPSSSIPSLGGRLERVPVGAVGGPHRDVTCPPSVPCRPPPWGARRHSPAASGREPGHGEQRSPSPRGEPGLDGGGHGRGACHPGRGACLVAAGSG